MAGVDSHPADVVADELALAGVQARSQLDVQRSHLIRHSTGTANPPRGAIEGGKKAVAHRLDLAAPVALELGAHELVVARKQLTPARVAERRGALGGGDDVGEHHSCEYAIGNRRLTSAGQELLDLLGVTIGITVERDVVHLRAARRAARPECARPCSARSRPGRTPRLDAARGSARECSAEDPGRQCR